MIRTIAWSKVVQQVVRKGDCLVVCLQNNLVCPACRRRPWLCSAFSTYAPGTPSSAGLARNAAAGASHTAISQTAHW